MGDTLSEIRFNGEVVGVCSEEAAKAISKHVDEQQAIIEALTAIKEAAQEYVSNSYRPTIKYDAMRFDALAALLEADKL